jgi:hypothetical protein
MYVASGPIDGYASWRIGECPDALVRATLAPRARVNQGQSRRLTGTRSRLTRADDFPAHGPRRTTDLPSP